MYVVIYISQCLLTLIVEKNAETIEKLKAESWKHQIKSNIEKYLINKPAKSVQLSN